MGVDPYYLMDQEAEQSPIGSNRLLYLPYLMGERTPHLDPDCRGVFFGLSAIHQKRDLLRAVLEGVAYSLNDCKNIIGGMGVPVSDMMACGGGGTSKIWRQMLADLYGCEVKTAANREGPALGVAILAMVGAGEYALGPGSLPGDHPHRQGPGPLSPKTVPNTPPSTSSIHRAVPRPQGEL